MGRFKKLRRPTGPEVTRMSDECWPVMGEQHSQDLLLSQTDRQWLDAALYTLCVSAGPLSRSFQCWLSQARPPGVTAASPVTQVPRMCRGPPDRACATTPGPQEPSPLIRWAAGAWQNPGSQCCPRRRQMRQSRAQRSRQPRSAGGRVGGFVEHTPHYSQLTFMFPK